MTVTVAIPTRNRGAMIEDCLRSILALEHRDFRVIVIDQSDNDATADAITALAGSDPRIEVIRTRRAGTSAARNLAAERSATEVVAYVDDDVTVAPDWLDVVLREFIDPGVVAVFSRVVPPCFGARQGTEIAFKASTARVEYSSRVPPWYIGHGAAMAVRREALLGTGGFDLSLGGGGAFFAGEDMDLAYRLIAAGGRVVYAGAATGYHKDWRDWKSRRRTERGYGIGAGALFTKYVRCGDLYGAALFGTWVWQLGVRRVGAGIFKWRSIRPVYLGYCQLVYPWIGLVRSLFVPIDCRSRTYRITQERESRPSPLPQSLPERLR